MSQFTIEKPINSPISPELYQTALEIIAQKERDDFFDEEFLDEYNRQIENLVTEDDTPVDNLFSAKQQRLLTQTLYNAWKPLKNDETPRPFFSEANIGLYFTLKEKAIVPDVLVSLDVTAPEDPHYKENRAYLVWVFGKVPEIVIEIVSNKKGEEFNEKLRRYEQMKIEYYVVFDPKKRLKKNSLAVFAHSADNGYTERESHIFKQFNLGLTLWEGEFEGLQTTWLRWTDGMGNLLPMPIEEKQTLLAENAELEKRSLAAEEKARKLTKKLQALGLNPEEI